MKKIKELSVKVTYRVVLGNVEVSDKVFEQLNELAESGDELDGTGMDYPEAVEWLRNNIVEGDCCDIEYEISDLT